MYFTSIIIYKLQFNYGSCILFPILSTFEWENSTLTASENEVIFYSVMKNKMEDFDVFIVLGISLKYTPEGIVFSFC